MRTNAIWYEEPAEHWTDAIPLGNGRLGAMVFGDAARERYQLNEDTLWTGGPYRPLNPEAKSAWPRVKKLVFEKRFEEAEKLIDASMMAVPLKQMSFQPAGDLWISTGHEAGISNYRRDLDIARAISTVSYEFDGTVFSARASFRPWIRFWLSGLRQKGRHRSTSGCN